MTRLIFSSFCRADEKLDNKQIFSLPNGKTHKSVISKHEHVHAKLYLKISKFCMYAATFGCKVYAFWVHVYGSVGCKVCGSWVQSIWILLGACLCLLGACLWIGWVHVCGCWVQVCGCWVQSLRLRLGACLTVGSLPDSR